VKRAVEAGLEAASKVQGGTVETWVIIPNPHENVETVLPIGFSDEVERFRMAVEGRPLLGS